MKNRDKKIFLFRNWAAGLGNPEPIARFYATYDCTPREASDEQCVDRFNTHFSDIIKGEDELIPEQDWHLDELRGIGEQARNHKDYLIMNRRKAGHSIKDYLIISPCNSGKPYFKKGPLRNTLRRCAGKYEPLCDLACISSPGIVEERYDSHYPYRYDDTQQNAEKNLDSSTEYGLRYNYASICRILDYHKQYPYTGIFWTGTSQRRNFPFYEIKRCNLDDSNNWLWIGMTKPNFDWVCDTVLRTTGKKCVIMRMANYQIYIDKQNEVFEDMVNKVPQILDMNESWYIERSKTNIKWYNPNRMYEFFDGTPKDLYDWWVKEGSKGYDEHKFVTPLDIIFYTLWREEENRVILIRNYDEFYHELSAVLREIYTTNLMNFVYSNYSKDEVERLAIKYSYYDVDYSIYQQEPKKEKPKNMDKLIDMYYKKGRPEIRYPGEGVE